MRHEQSCLDYNYTAYEQAIQAVDQHQSMLREFKENVMLQPTLLDLMEYFYRSQSHVVFDVIIEHALISGHPPFSS